MALTTEDPPAMSEPRNRVATLLRALESGSLALPALDPSVSRRNPCVVLGRVAAVHHCADPDARQDAAVSSRSRE